KFAMSHRSVEIFSLMTGCKEFFVHFTYFHNSVRRYTRELHPADVVDGEWIEPGGYLDVVLREAGHLIAFILGFEQRVGLPAHIILIKLSALLVGQDVEHLRTPRPL